VADLAIAIKIATEDASSGPIEKIKGALGGLGQAMAAPGHAIGGLIEGFGKLGLAAGGIQAVIGGLKGIGDNVFGLGALNEIEQTRARLDAFTKDGAKTEELIAGIRKEAALTPFGFGEMAKATASLLPVSKSANVSLEELTKTAEILAASNPEQGLEGAAFALREAVSGDFGSIIDRFDLPRQRINELKAQGVPALEAIRTAMKEMGLDADLVAKQGETLSGRWSTFQDTLTTLQTKMGQPIFDALKEGLLGLQGVLDDNTDTFEAWADQVAAGIKGVIDVTKGLTAIFLGGGDFDQIGEMLDTFFPFDVSTDIMIAISDLGVAFKAVFQEDIPTAIDAGLLVLQDLGFIISDLVEDWAASIAGWVDGASDNLLGNLGDLGLDINAWILDSAISIIEKLGTWAAAFLDWIGPMIPDLLRAMGSNLSAMWGWMGGTALPLIVTKLAEWGLAFVEWIGPRIVPMLTELGKLELELLGWLIGTALPAIVGKLAEWAGAFVDWVAPKIPPLLLELGKLGFALGEWMVTTALPDILAKLAEWATAFVEWVAPKIPPLLEALGGLLVQVGTWLLTTALPDLVLKLAEWAGAFVAWVAPRIPDLLLELGKLEVEVILWIGQKVADLVSKLAEWGGAFLGWVAKDVLPTLPEKLGAILTAITGWVGEKVGAVAESVKSIGSGMLQGIQDGISGALGGFWSWLQTSFVDKIPTFVKNILGIQSPSRVMFDIGVNLVEGLRLGMEKRLPSVEDVIKRAIGGVGQMSGAVDDWLKAAISYTGVGMDWLPGLRWLVAHESGGDPTAKNPDSTATGLFQLIDTTWAGSRDKRLPDDIRNPVINSIAAIRYIKGRYGDADSAIDFWRKNNYYAEGGWITEPVVGIGMRSGQGYSFGERGEPELVTPRSRMGASGAGGDTFNFYGVQPESVFAEAERRQRQQAFLRGPRRS
jgi:SLT domain-containing protein